MNIKIKGKNEGFKAEYLIEKYLHCKNINELSETHLKKFIFYNHISCNHTDEILSNNRFLNSSTASVAGLL